MAAVPVAGLNFLYRISLSTETYFLMEQQARMVHQREKTDKPAAMAET
jgi:hypothetical protein